MRRLAPCFSSFALGAVTLASCGGEDDQEGVEDLLDKAFSGEIHSADLKLEAEVELKGLVKDPIKIEAEGPFRTNEGKLPSADIELRIGTGGGGQTITSGVLTTGDRVFLKFQDVYYEQPPAQVRQTNRGARQAQGPAGRCAARARPALVARRGQGRGRRGGGGRRHPPRVRDARRGQPDAQPQQVRAPVGERARVEGTDTPTPRSPSADIRELSATRSRIRASTSTSASRTT